MVPIYASVWEHMLTDKHTATKWSAAAAGVAELAHGPSGPFGECACLSFP